MLVKLLKHFKAFVIMLIILSVLLGVFAFKTFPKEASPAINVPFFTISVVYPGADPDTVEKQIIKKLENNLTTISQVKHIDSVSAYNVGVVSVEFERSKDSAEAYNDLNSAIDKTKGDFPDISKEPILKKVDVTDAPIYTFSITGEYLPSVLYDKIRSLEDKLKQTSGVGEVTIVGDYVPGVKIKFDYEKMLQNKLNFSYAISEINNNLDKFPADKKEIGKNLFTFTLRNYPKDLDSLDEYLENIDLINKSGNTLKLSDVAKITVGPYKQKKETYLMQNGKTSSSVTYFIKRVPGTDIIETINSIKVLLNKEIPNDLRFVEIHSQKEKINSTYKTFISNFWQTSLIIFFIILIFIGFKESIGITIVFPLVYLITFVILKSIGYTFNNIVSFSLVLTLGIMVDNLIVVIEGFEEGLNKGLKKWDAIGFSISSYWKPIVSGNFTTISMFFPIGFMLSGKIGDFMKYMPTTIDAVLIVSMFVSLIFLPIVLTSLNFKKSPPLAPPLLGEGKKKFLPTKRWKVRMVELLEGFFKKTIRNYKKSILVFVILFFVTIGFASQFLKADFLPPVDTNNIYLNLKFEPNITLEENKKIVYEIAKKINNYFEKNKGLLEYQSLNIGNYKTRLPLDNVVYANSYNPDLSFIDLKLTDKDNIRNYESFKIVSDLKNFIHKEDFSKKIKSLEFFIMKSGPSGGKDVNFFLVGDKIESLVKFYNKLESKLQSITGTSSWSNSLEYTNGKIDITWDSEKLKQFNITAHELDLLIASLQTSKNYEPNGILLKRLDDFSSDLVEVKAFTKIENNDILEIMVPGRDIYLKQLIKNTKLTGELKNINHNDNNLVLSVGAYKTKETSLGSITPKVEEYIAEIQKEIPNVYLEYAGDIKDMQNSMKNLGKAFLVGIILMFSVLVLHFGNFRQAFLVLSVIPFLFIGAIFALTLIGLPFSFPAQLGMFGLMGVGVNDAILLIERYNNEINNPPLTPTFNTKGGGQKVDELILDVIRARFKPVLLTTLTTVMGLSTLAIKDDLWGSLAVAFIGGLLLGTFIILVYIPAMLKWGLERKNNSK